MSKLPLFKLWLACGGYILALILCFAFIFPNAHLPVLLELLLKGTAVLAFCMLLLLPALNAAGRSRQGGRHPALMAAAGTMVAGYALLLGQVVYIKLKTCDINATPYDSQWHCNVEGKSFIAYIMLIPVLAAIAGMTVGGVCWFVRKLKKPVD